MKIKNGFTTNSSSASFTINLDDITIKQLGLIYDHSKYADGNDWNLIQTEEHIVGNTWMDNFDMEEYLIKIGIDMSKVDWRNG